MTLAVGKALLMVLGVAVLPSCTLLSPAQMETKKYLLNTVPRDLSPQSRHAATLLLLAPETTPVYATPLMAYTTKAHEIAYFSRNEWAATPAQMLPPLIAETLRQTGYFRAVVPAPHVGQHTFVLRTEILALQQDFTTDPAVVRLAIRFSLSREASNQLIATRELSVQEPMPERSPYGGVVAANAAVAKLLRDLAGFVLANAR